MEKFKCKKIEVEVIVGGLEVYQLLFIPIARIKGAFDVLVMTGGQTVYSNKLVLSIDEQPGYHTAVLYLSYWLQECELKYSAQ